ncbi:uncharacterized protein LOC124126862 isoform X1 [Haliotis rufescens]|uniref:uncharacterized protein LOC125377714 isoform X1 n=1 Tax=Haliotis rufescens TaxID=6454 RepID=UPI00201FA0B1|nr:uncharacterized protein LOC125377714 isoform X1 [Haliotis rufescens]XP_048247703.1 uncharacterized protein LOC124126862 isoform X1 [Haliotis rufescens]
MFTRMAVIEQTKLYPINCFVCLSSGNSISFKLSGRKCVEDNILAKLCFLLDAETVSLLHHHEAGLCRNCFIKINNFMKFKDGLQTSVKKYICRDNKIKRHSLLTDCSTPDSKRQSIACEVEDISELNIDLSTCKKNATSYTENKRSSPASHNEESDASSFSVQKEAEHIYAASPCTKICSNGTGPDEKPKAAVGEHNYCLDLPPKQKLPSTFSTHESFAEVGKQPQQTYLHGLMQAVASEDLEQVVTLLLSHPSSRNKINERVIQQLQSDCQELSSLSSPSVLREQSSLQNLTDSHDFIGQVFQEMKERAPFLLAVMSTVTGCMDGEIPLNKVAAITSSYSILMRMRNIHLTAWHKMVGCILIRGHLEDQSMVLLSNIGLCQSPTTKLRMMAQAVTQTKLNIVRSLQCNPLIKDIPALSWLNIPTHIPHSHSKTASMKTEVHPMPLLFSNEAKYEECVKILDSYEDQLTELFTSAHGDQSALRELHVPVGGDQLTRVRLEGAKSLRALSPTPAKRFDDLGPFVIEWWHNKQDFLEKAYKALFSPRSIRQPGTLYFYKAKFNMTNVNGNVKRNFQSHHDLLVHVGKAVIVEQAREYFGNH